MSKLHKSKRRQRTKGVTTAPVKVTYTEYSPTGESKMTSRGPMPVMNSEQKTTTLPSGTTATEVRVYKKKKDAEGKQVLKKVKRKYKTKTAVYKSKTKVKQRGKHKGQTWQCKGPGVDCPSPTQSVTKRKRLIKKP